MLRLEGTNVDEGKKILKNSGLNFIVADTMKDAAEKVVAAARPNAEAAGRGIRQDDEQAVVVTFRLRIRDR